MTAERNTRVVQAKDITVGMERIAGGRITAIRTSASGKTVYVTSEKYGTERLTPTVGVCMYAED